MSKKTSTTSEEYDSIIKLCQDIFVKKMQDYGTAWRVLRPTSVTDQIFIKANRIRSIEEKGEAKIDETVSSEFIGVVNYSLIGLIQLDLQHSNGHSKGYSSAYSSEHASEHTDMEQSGQSIDQEGNNQEIIKQYLSYFNKAKALMMDKNHDYDEAWRSMRISSYTDLILMKIKRTKQIEDNKGSTLISEGIDANYYDMINYGVFALIRLTL
ncbi:hypothetical protein FACS1894199_02240 [Bacteroidia bacterium]|nr:hypothetical protein FACS1894199_02240 [Bacteroidia bacterium]